MRDATTLKEDIARTAESLIRTTGDGRATEVVGEARVSVESIPMTLDILAATLATTGTDLRLGTFRDAVLTFDDGIVVLGHDDQKATVAVLAQSSVAAGLLLNQVRRLLRIDTAEDDA